MSTAPVIRFSCPQGHRLSSPVQQAGRPGKCPKCGVSFMVPMTDSNAVETPPAETQREETDDSPLASFAFLNTPSATDTPPASSTLPSDSQGSSSSGRLTPERPAGEPPSRPDLVVFLCPNGHRLNGPAKLAGRAGQCPHCGVKFIIPDADEGPDESEDEGPAGFDFSDLATVNRMVQSETVTAGGKPLAGAAVPPQDVDQSLPPPALSSHAAPAGRGTQHPMAALFARLWSYRGIGVSIEVHLGEGKILLPESFAADASQHEMGIFAQREANGRTTLSAVRWDAISRIAVKGLAEPPSEFFPG